MFKNKELTEGSDMRDALLALCIEQLEHMNAPYASFEIVVMIEILRKRILELPRVSYTL